MSKKLVCVYDAKTESFGDLVQAQTLPQAIRLFTDLVSEKSTEFGKHPEDFSLHHVGDYSQETGLITPCEPVCVVRGVDVVRVCNLGGDGHAI